MPKTTKEIIGYVHVSGIFGVILAKKYKKDISVSDDIFTCEMSEYEDKRVKITIEVIEDDKNN